VKRRGENGWGGGRRGEGREEGGGREVSVCVFLLCPYPTHPSQVENGPLVKLHLNRVSAPLLLLVHAAFPCRLYMLWALSCPQLMQSRVSVCS